MAYLTKNSRCRDCIYCKAYTENKGLIFTYNETKGECLKGIRQKGFDIDAPVPQECIGKDYK
jgi:hypothetical protein